MQPTRGFVYLGGIITEQFRYWPHYIIILSVKTITVAAKAMIVMLLLKKALFLVPLQQERGIFFTDIALLKDWFCQIRKSLLLAV